MSDEIHLPVFELKEGWHRLSQNSTSALWLPSAWKAVNIESDGCFLRHFPPQLMSTYSHLKLSITVSITVIKCTCCIFLIFLSFKWFASTQ